MTAEVHNCALLPGPAGLQERPGRAVSCGPDTPSWFAAPGGLACRVLLAGAGAGRQQVAIEWVPWFREVVFLIQSPSEVDGVSVTGFTVGEGLRYWRPAREVLLAALAARWAAIEGKYEAVDDFTRNVLGHADVARWRDAVTAALLGDWVDRLGSYLTDPELLAILRGYTAAERRRWTEVWEHRFGGFQWRAPDGTVRTGKGKRVWMLETPNRDGVTVRDVYPDKPAADALVLEHDFTDPRIDAVLRGLDPTEAAVANLWASRKATWADAALDLGLPAAYGDKVRRKLSHLGNRHTQHTAAAVTR